LENKSGVLEDLDVCRKLNLCLADKDMGNQNEELPERTHLRNYLFYNVEKFVLVEGLYYPACGAGLLALVHFRCLRLCSKDNYWQKLVAGILADLADQPDSVEIWHVHIGNYKVELLGVRFRNAVQSVDCLNHIVACAFKNECNAGANCGRVVDNKDSLGHSASLHWSSTESAPPRIQLSCAGPSSSSPICRKAWPL